jgi:hypothetical protein
MRKQEPLKQIPMGVACERFRYIGIDSDPESIQFVSKKYPDNYPTFKIAKIESAKDLQRVLSEEAIEPIDILAVDVEGWEKFIFAKDWHLDLIRPRYIAVEFHPQFLRRGEHEGSLEHFGSNLERAGYLLYREEITNRQARTQLTIEQQWIQIGGAI